MQIDLYLVPGCKIDIIDDQFSYWRTMNVICSYWSSLLWGALRRYKTTFPQYFDFHWVFSIFYFFIFIFIFCNFSLALLQQNATIIRTCSVRIILNNIQLMMNSNRKWESSNAKHRWCISWESPWVTERERKWEATCRHIHVKPLRKWTSMLNVMLRERINLVSNVSLFDVIANTST